jgi:hypothetical protein
MHREILGLSDSRIKGEHRNGEGLDNQQENIRPASNSQNLAAYRRLRTTNASRFRGVFRIKDRPNWRAQITVNYKSKYLGYFGAEEDAARAYDAAAKQIFGEFAQLNFP